MNMEEPREISRPIFWPCRYDPEGVVLTDDSGAVASKDLQWSENKTTRKGMICVQLGRQDAEMPDPSVQLCKVGFRTSVYNPPGWYTYEGVAFPRRFRSSFTKERYLPVGGVWGDIDLLYTKDVNSSENFKYAFPCYKGPGGISDKSMKNTKKQHLR